MTTIGNHNHDAASAAPRATGGPVAPAAARTYFSPEGVRRDALDKLAKTGLEFYRVGEVVSAAAVIEQYILQGVPEKPAPGANLFPLDFVSVAIHAGASTLYAVQVVLAERQRQLEKGYDAEHDDGHADGRIAFEAGVAILPDGSRTVEPITAEGWSDPWIDRLPHQGRAAQLVQGIALALAELERVHRENDRANAKAVEEASAEVEVPGYVPVEMTRELDTFTGEGGRQVHVPLYTTTNADTAISEDKPTEKVEELAVAVETFNLRDARHIHHALGNPSNPRKKTFRNYFATDETAPEGKRFRELSDLWTVRADQLGREGSVVASVTQAGREALAAMMAAEPELFTDIRIQNGKPA